MDVSGRRVVELGCGLGLPSLVALERGADVLATDWYPEALDLAAANARACTGRALATMLVDWRDPPAALLARPADLVIGADVLYETRNGVALAALLPRLVAPGGTVLIADPRRPDAASLLDPLAEAGWSEEREEVVHGGRVDESGPVIRLHTLRPRLDSVAT
jgi:predicted nicotinamide N-methyase